MKANNSRVQTVVVWLAAVAMLAALVAAASRSYWWPQLQRRVAGFAANSAEGGKQHGAKHHAHDHPQPHEGHLEADALTLSDVAWKNIGLKTGVVQPSTYVRTVSVPAMVVERAGRSQVEITAPLTGTVTAVHPLEGEAVQPGEPLFELRLTHEDLVTAQRDFLRSAQELDVVKREIQRLESVGEGIIAGRRVLEQEYEQQKLEAALHAQRQGLLLHGLSEAQIDQIRETGQLLDTLTVTVPPFDTDVDHHDVEHLYHVQKLNVKRGQHVAAGATLGILADHCLLYVEGQAFEDDAQRLTQAAREGWSLKVSPASTRSAGAGGRTLQVLYVADQVDPDSRALRFYLSLPNQLVRDERESGHRFVAWKFRPGQRMEVTLPIGQAWQNQIVLPPEAVVEEGAEAFVFQQNGDHFDRLPVHIVFRDKDAVVVENDRRLAGSTLAMSGAYQMHLAIKNRASDVDPHAGHQH